MKPLFRIYSAAILAILLAVYSSFPVFDKDSKDNCKLLLPGQKGFMQLVNDEEPGEPLVIYGRVIDRKTWRPVRDVSFFLYHTDAKGYYNSPGPDDQARIRGTVNTNTNGCFKIKTILPGDYPDRKNSRHIHYVINAKGYKEIKSTLFFKGFTTPNITEQGPFTVLDIKKDSTGAWTGETNFFMALENK